MKSRGFTLVELAIVVLILSIVLSIALPNLGASRELAAQTACEAERRTAERADLTYSTRHGAHAESLTALVEEGLLGSEPGCPSQGVWSWVPSGFGTERALVCSIHGLPPELETEPALIEPQPDFLDDFFGEGEWSEILGNTFARENGLYLIGTPEVWTGEHRTFVGDETWSDYAVTINATLTDGNGFGLYFRSTDFEQADAYIFQYDPGYAGGEFIMRQVKNGNEYGPFARARPPEGFEWYGVEREIRIEVSGDTYTAYIDDEEVLVGTHGEYTEGAVGLRTWHRGQLQLSSLQIDLE